MKRRRITAMAIALFLLLFTGCQGTAKGTANQSNPSNPPNQSSQTNQANQANQGSDGLPLGNVENEMPKTGNDSIELDSLAELDSQDKTVLTADTADATVLSFDGTSVRADGNGCLIDGTTVTIQAAGTYVLQGTLQNGCVIVDTDKNSVVNLVFNGVTITNNNSAAVFVKKSQKTIISLENGTINTLTDGTKYVYADENGDEPSAALFSKSDLTINGSGTLVVNGNYNDAIQSKDSLKLLGGIYQITSVDDGIIGKDMLVIESGSYQIKAQGDGIKSSNDKDETLGFILISGGEFDIAAGNDAIQAETKLLVLDGSFRIVTGGGSANAEPHAEDRFGFGGFGGWMDRGNATEQTDTESRKGLKAGTALQIKDGTFMIDACDDALHSNGTIQIDAGEYTIAAGDDAVHADTSLVINGGKLTITQSYEGLEAASIIINDGEFSIAASDDGINAAGGRTASLVINGGVTYVSAQGDGLDSNGSIVISNGTVFVDGPTNGGNGALDYDTTASIDGGTVVFAGSIGMAAVPSSSSGQASIALTFSKVQAAGTSVVLYNAQGKEIFRYTPAKEFQHLILSSSEIKRGEAYSVTYGSNSIDKFTLLDSAVTYVSSDGSVTDRGNSGGMGGFGGDFHGGFNGRPNEGQGGFGGAPDGNPDDNFGGGRKH